MCAELDGRHAWTSWARDAIVLREASRSPSFSPAFSTWALQRPCMLVFDEHDAGHCRHHVRHSACPRWKGRLTLPDRVASSSRTRLSVCSPRPTVGLGEDRVVSRHATAQPGPDGTAGASWSPWNYLPHDKGSGWWYALPGIPVRAGTQTVSAMVALCDLDASWFYRR